jgi:hypothetical protein
MPSDKSGLLFLRAGRPVQPDPAMLDACTTHAPQRWGHWPSSPDITAAMQAHLQKAQLWPRARPQSGFTAASQSHACSQIGSDRRTRGEAGLRRCDGSEGAVGDGISRPRSHDRTRAVRRSHRAG